MIAHFHLPGLFEFHELYKRLLPIYQTHRAYFYDHVEISSIYGAPYPCLWAGGRIEYSNTSTQEVIELMNRYDISPRLTFSNSLIEEKHLSDPLCNQVTKAFKTSSKATGIIITSDLLMDYLKTNYPGFYYISSTTKVLTKLEDLYNEAQKGYDYIVPDFRLNKDFNLLETLPKEKLEFLVNECCDRSCPGRKACYQNVSAQNLGLDIPDFKCQGKGGKDGYRFSLAMQNESFISNDDILHTYLPKGYRHFKIEGRGLGSALVLEMLLYYLVKPEYQIHVREAIYLDTMLDLF